MVASFGHRGPLLCVRRPWLVILTLAFTSLPVPLNNVRKSSSSPSPTTATTTAEEETAGLAHSPFTYFYPQRPRWSAHIPSTTALDSLQLLSLDRFVAILHTRHPVPPFYHVTTHGLCIHIFHKNTHHRGWRPLGTTRRARSPCAGHRHAPCHPPHPQNARQAGHRQDGQPV